MATRRHDDSGQPMFTPHSIPFARVWPEVTRRQCLMMAYSGVLGALLLDDETYNFRSANYHLADFSFSEDITNRFERNSLQLSLSDIR